MIKEEVAVNIYARWYHLLQNKGRGATLKPIRSLEDFALDEIHELIYLLQERMKAIRKSE